MAIYLDNAATSFPKPPEVHQAVAATLRDAGANPGRGGHHLALEAGRIVFEAREAAAEIIGAHDASRIAFTGNATEAINFGLFGLLRPGDRVVTSTMEHNAVTRPLRALQDQGLCVVKVRADERGRIDPGEIRRACAEKKTTMVVLSHCSNVTGTLQPIEDIGPWCRREGIVFFVDAAQSAGIFSLDVDDMGIDLLAAPGHKGLLGPQGTGFLYVREGLEPRPLVYGGTGANSSSDLPPEHMPERLEAGTLNTPGLAGLTAGIRFLQREGLAAIRAHEAELLGELIEGLSAIAGMKLHGPLDPLYHGGALSLTLGEYDPAEIGFLLDREYGILARVGLHCAPDAHRTIGTFPRGTVRLSPGYFNTLDEMRTVVGALSALAAHPPR
ncbi:aminotransferase class V-fold PLP-dependent enzyme [Geoalkalibacter sp.]|jgi:cysteine desulfurase family protein|uniref:aminotransferase class V-fold PLP-dependent enzyme n=1 Tax=Geoalkalibacter sp. TaxID=3041440 RepID=UPI00272E984A|nr:aminotransferase class V-fold PLP-dependent enzyme [Geoalkalibacter sp.]